MHCTNCGKEINREAAFCKHCGARQHPPPSTPPTPTTEVETNAASLLLQARVGTHHKTWIWAGAVGVLLALVGGGIGFWGWTNKLASDEAMRRLADDIQRRAAAEEEKRRSAAEEEKRRSAAEEEKRRAAEVNAIERAEIAAAQAALDKQIAEEENQAKARTGAK